MDWTEHRTKLPEQKGSRNPINRAVQLAACMHLCGVIVIYPVKTLP
jgi:hypothetical protein